MNKRNSNVALKSAEIADVANEVTATDQNNGTTLKMERGNPATAKMRPTPTIREKVASEREERAKAKLTLFQDARQKLAEANDLYGEGEAKAKEAQLAASNGGLMLYKALTEGGASQDDISSVLVDQFGAAPKKDGKPGKTPAGKGNAIRQRIMRAHAASLALSGNFEDQGFFPEGIENVSVEIGDDTYSLAEIVAGMEAGNIPLFTAYDYFAKLKAEMKDPTPLALDVKRLAKIVSEMSDAANITKILASDDLVTAYSALADAIDIILSAPAEAKAA